jgi:aminoglycoside/choline kinase family phosphotransferase
VPWLSAITERYRELIPVLLEAEQTVIHGEFTVHNVMVSDSRIYPTDWETAAVAPGEIDIMCLVDAWDAETVAACLDAYVEARWPMGAPRNLADRLLAAELYLHLRWLGESPDLMLDKRRIWRFERLEELARQRAET